MFLQSLFIFWKQAFIEPTTSRSSILDMWISIIDSYNNMYFKIKLLGYESTYTRKKCTILPLYFILFQTPNLERNNNITIIQAGYDQLHTIKNLLIIMFIQYPTLTCLGITLHNLQKKQNKNVKKCFTRYTKK